MGTMESGASVPKPASVSMSTPVKSVGEIISRILPVLKYQDFAYLWYPEHLAKHTFSFSNCARYMREPTV